MEYYVAEDLPHLVRTLFVNNTQTNFSLQKYLAVVERPNPEIAFFSHQGCCLLKFLPLTVTVTPIPTPTSATEMTSERLGVVVVHSATGAQDTPAPDHLFEVGRVVSALNDVQLMAALSDDLPH